MALKRCFLCEKLHSGRCELEVPGRETSSIQEPSPPSPGFVVLKRRGSSLVTVRRETRYKRQKLLPGLVREKGGRVRMDKAGRDLIFKRQHGQHFRPRTTNEMRERGLVVEKDKREIQYARTVEKVKNPKILLAPWAIEIGKKYDKGWNRDPELQPFSGKHYCGKCKRETFSRGWNMVEDGILIFGKPPRFPKEAVVWRCGRCGNEDWIGEEVEARKLMNTSEWARYGDWAEAEAAGVRVRDKDPSGRDRGLKLRGVREATLKDMCGENGYKEGFYVGGKPYVKTERKK